MKITKAKDSPKTAEIVFLLLIISLFIAIIAAIAKVNVGGAPKANSGVLDLSGWDFEKQGTIMISGKWAFYWDKLADPGDSAPPDLYASVPDVWNNYAIGGKKLPAYGYATYILRVEGVNDQPLSIRVPPCSTAYAFYIDGRLFAQNGTVTRTEKGFVPEYAPENVTFTPARNAFTITMVVSNYIYARGGAWYPAILGTPAQIGKLDRQIEQKDWFLIGSFTTISMFCFCIFFLAKRDPPILLFAVLALVTALRTTLYGSYILSFFTRFRLVVVADYLTLVWLSALIALFLLSLADRDKIKKRAPPIAVIAGLLTVFIILTPILFLQSLPFPSKRTRSHSHFMRFFAC